MVYHYNPNLAQISFVADVYGTYKLRLIVSDGKAYSDPVDVTITAGFDMVDVPNLVGKTQQEAETACPIPRPLDPDKIRRNWCLGRAKDI